MRKFTPLPKLFILGILLFLLLTSAAQPSKQFTFTHYSTQNGLLSNQVNTIVQDSTGYLWIGTNDGLIRYDGSRYKSFRHTVGKSGSLPSNQVVQLIYDLRNNLWVLFSNGSTGIFNTSNFTFREAVVRIERTQSLRAAAKKLVLDEYGNIMLLFDGTALLTYNQKINEFSTLHNFIYFNKDWKIHDIKQQPGTNKYWLAFQSGLAVFNKTTNNLSYSGRNTENEKVISLFGSLRNTGPLFFDNKNRLWLNSFDSIFSHIYCYNFAQDEPLLNNYHFIDIFRQYYEVSGFYQFRNGSIWIRGFKVFGYFNEEDKKFDLTYTSTLPTGIDFRYISCLYEDRENNLWIGTGNNGIFHTNPSMVFFTSVAHPDRKTGAPEGDGTTVGIITDSDGSFLTGTWPDGLYRFDKKLAVVPVDIKGIDEKKVSIYDGYHSRDGRTLWMGAAPGIYAYDKLKRTARFFDPPVLQRQTVRAIAEDPSGSIWLGMRHMGLVKWDLRGDPQPFTAIPPQQIMDIVVDSKGLLWVACALTGLYVVDPASMKLVMHFHVNGKEPFRLPEEAATAVRQYNDSIVVIGTPHHMLLFDRKNKKTTPLTSDDTIYGTLSSIEQDTAGNLWVSTTSAIYRANPVTRVFIEFNRDDGIVNDYFVPGASATLPDGRIVFGAPVNFIVFDPGVIDLRTPSPQVTITDIKVGNRSLPADSVMRLPVLELDHSDNSLTVDFATLNYGSPFAVLYKLDNIDEDWKTADKSKQAVYSYLAPGNYILRFKAIDAEGQEKDDVLTLNISIEPPFYRTWWFYSMIVLMLGSILYWIDRQRIQRLKNEQLMRIAIAANLHQDVNTTLRNINVLSEIASMKSDQQPEQAREYLKEIQYKSRSMVVAMDDVLWSVNPENDSMPKTLERIRQVTDTISSRYNVGIHIEDAESIGKLKPDMKTRL